mgnify:FL=1
MGLPVVVIDRGRVQHARMARERVSEADILHAARSQEGIGELAALDYAVLERSGGISVVPRK